MRAAARRRRGTSAASIRIAAKHHRPEDDQQWADVREDVADEDVAPTSTVAVSGLDEVQGEG